jgi:hypothetical protein
MTMSYVSRLIEQAPFHPPTICNNIKAEEMVHSNDSSLIPMAGKVVAVPVEAEDLRHPLVADTKVTSRYRRSTNEAASRIAESRISNRSSAPLRVCHHVIKGASSNVVKGRRLHLLDALSKTVLS